MKRMLGLSLAVVAISMFTSSCKNEEVVAEFAGKVLIAVSPDMAKVWEEVYANDAALRSKSNVVTIAEIEEEGLKRDMAVLGNMYDEFAKAGIPVLVISPDRIDQYYNKGRDIVVALGTDYDVLGLDVDDILHFYSDLI